MLGISCQKKFRTASSTLEYVSLIVFILSALYVFQTYIFRGISGHWKGASDTIGFGRQYDPREYGTDGTGGGTMECMFDYLHCKSAGANMISGANMIPPCELINSWIDRRIYEKNCDCTLPPEDPQYITKCLICVEGAKTPGCGSAE